MGHLRGLCWRSPQKSSGRTAGFSLVELLLVIAIIALLAALLLPALSKAYTRGKRAGCVTNLKQIGLAFHTFAHEHGDKLPMQVSTNAGGSMEFASTANFAFRHLQTLSNELVDPKLLICPADTRLPAENFAKLKNENVSYFVATAAEFGQTDSMLSGDRNIASGGPFTGPILRVASNNPPTWTHELHDQVGHILFGDGHVDLFSGAGLVSLVADSKRTVPIVVPSASSGSSSSYSGGSSYGGGNAGGANANGTSGGSSSSSGGPSSGGSSSGSSSGNSSGSGGGNSGGGLARLEQLFQGPPDKARSISAPPGTRTERQPAGQSIVMADPVVTSGSVAAAPQTNRNTRMTGASPAAPDVTPGDPWAVSLGQLVTKFGSRGTWLLLLILVATLITIEVIRRRRARKKRESAL